MTTAREIMTESVDFLEASATVLEAAEKLASGDYGALPICDGGTVTGMITDRDIVVKVVAKGKDPAATVVGDLAQGTVVTVGPDDTLEDVSAAMSEHQVRRLPVVDGTALIGIVSQADLALSGQDATVGNTVQAISR